MDVVADVVTVVIAVGLLKVVQSHGVCVGHEVVDPVVVVDVIAVAVVVVVVKIVLELGLTVVVVKTGV